MLTYQSLAAVGSSPAWSDAARSHWLTELTADGRSAGSAEAWLKRLEADNPRAYNRGLRSRATTIRRQVDELDDDAIDSILGPGARARLDALITAGVATIVLDECHHLKAHWAIVVHYLVRRLKQAGLSPTLIGLTATEPSGEDRSARRYRALLGDVDAEVPVPAVIRAGHLAPCRQLAWFTLPSTEETTFLATAGEELHHRVGELLLSPDGIDYLLEVVAPPISSTAPGGGSGSGPLPRIAGADDHHVSATAKPPEEDELVRRIVAGFDADPLLAASAAALLRKTGSYRGTALSTRVVPLLPELDLLDLDDELRLLGRYAHDRLLAAPERRRDWESTRELLRGFGLYLTEDLPLDAAEVAAAGSTRAALTAMIAAATGQLYARTPSTAYAVATVDSSMVVGSGASANLSTHTLYRGDFASGAVIRNIVDRAKKAAIKEQLQALTAGADASSVGLGTRHLLEAVRAEFEDQVDLPPLPDIEDALTVAGVRGRLVSVEPPR